MTVYKFEFWVDSTSDTSFHVIKVTDPYGETIGEVKTLAEETSLRLAHELKKADSTRFAIAHGFVR